GFPRHVSRVCANQTPHWGVPSGRRSGPLRGGGAGAGGDPRGGRERCGPRRGAGGGQAVRRGRGSESASVGLIGTVAVHALAGLFLVAGAAAARKPVPPTYRVHLVAATEPTPAARTPPEGVERPAEANPAPAPN